MLDEGPFGPGQFNDHATTAAARGITSRQDDMRRGRLFLTSILLRRMAIAALTAVRSLSARSAAALAAGRCSLLVVCVFLPWGPVRVIRIRT